MFNMITRTNEVKTLAEYISCDRKYKFDNSNQKWNNVKCQ